MYQAVPHSRPALATVVVAHVAAALLFVQIMEARQYIEPVPLSVTLLPEIQAPTPTPTPRSDPVSEPAPPQLQPPVPLPMMPEPVREVRLDPEPVRKPVAEPEPLQEPLSPVRLEPEPIVREVVPEPLARMPEPEPVRNAFVEPVPVRDIEYLPTPPAPAPEPRSRTMTETVMPPVSPAPPPVTTIASPQPVPVIAPTPPPPAAARPASPPATAAAERDDVIMDSRVLTAVYLSNPKPLYPNVSRRLGEQGTVMLRVFVTVAGEPARIELKSSSGFPRLDRAALNAVRSWKFSPATRSDQAVDAWVLVPIRFSLKG